MRALVIVALATAGVGCTVGGSSSVVGRWRARRIIDSTVCVRRPAPDVGPGGRAPAEPQGCEQTIAIGRDVPARSFSSLTFTFPASGYMQQRGGERGFGHGVVLQSHFEYLRGRGRYALGARVGAQIGDGFGRRVFWMMPVSVLGHIGGLWGSVYAGAGYAPVAAEQQYVGEGEMATTLPSEYHHNSVHVFVGTRFWLRRTLERGLSFNPEFRVETFGDSTLTSLTGNIGLHF